MTWVKLDDRFPWHPKVIGLNNRAFRLYVEALCYSAAHLLDGKIPRNLRTLTGTAKTARELVQAGLWVDTESAYVIHDYLVYNPSREQVEAERAIAARRAALRASPELMRDVKARDGGRCRYCGVHVDWSNRRGPLGGTYDHVIPISQGGDDSFENIVTACRKCNSGKSGRRPEQCNYKLLPVVVQNEPSLHRSDNSGHPRGGRDPTDPLSDRDGGESFSEQDPDPDPDPTCQVSPSARVEAQAVFEHWQVVHKHTGSKLDRKRRARIEARLRDGFTVDQLCKAISNAKNDRFLMGENEHGRVYDGLETLLRDAAQVERLEALTERPSGAQRAAAKPPGAVEHEARTGRPADSPPPFRAERDGLEPMGADIAALAQRAAAAARGSHG